MSYGRDWYQQTRNPTQGRTVRQELGELAAREQAVLASVARMRMGY